MDVTEAKVTLHEHTGDAGRDRLLAYASVTLDGAIAIHDMKLIEGAAGPFVAFPDRDLFTPCPRCESRVALRHRHCPMCGLGQSPGRVAVDVTGRPFLLPDGRPRRFFDVIHPTTPELRRAITRAVVAEYHRVMAGAFAAEAIPA